LIHTGKNLCKAKKENETMKKTVLFTLCSVFLAPVPAFANQPPAGNSMLYEMLMFLVLIALTAAGGGYAVLSKKKPGRRWTKWIGYTLLSLAALVLGMLLLVVLIVAIWGIQRGVMMIKWGGQARPGKHRPEYLSQSNPWRLITAGAVLIVLMVTLAAAAFMTVGVDDAYVARGRAVRLNDDARNAYMGLMAYEAQNPKATGAVSCDDLEKTGFIPLHRYLCTSDIMMKSGKTVSGSIKLTLKPGLMTPNLTKPEAVITYNGELTEAKP